MRAAELRWGSAPPDPFSLPDRAAWIVNLEQLGVDYLCVYRQFSEIDPQLRFPVEEEWAAADPGRFEPVWSSRWARLYRLRGAGSPVPR